MTDRESLRRLSVLMFTGFVDMAGSSIIFTQLPFYAKRFGASDIWVGFLISAFFLAQLLTAPLWGRFSDRHGRRRAILIGLSISIVAFALFGISSSDRALELLGPVGAMGLLLLMRLAQGVGGGTISVVQAYVSDATAPEKRAQALGWVTAAISAGVLIGPKLGSMAFLLGPEMPGLVAAGLCALNWVSAWRFLPESMAARTKPVESQSASITGAVWQVLVRPNTPVATLIWVYAFGMLAFFGLNGVLTLYLHQRFGFTETSIGDFFLYIGVISLVARGLVIGWLVKAIGEVGTMRVGAFSMALGMLLIPWAHSLPTLAVAAIFTPLGTALLFPATTSLTSQRYARDQAGLGLGVQQSFGGVARVLGPTLATAAFALTPQVPFWLGGVVMLLVALYTFRLDGSRPSAAEPVAVIEPEA
jgi:MFS family permease